MISKSNYYTLFVLIMNNRSARKFFKINNKG